MHMGSSRLCLCRKCQVVNTTEDRREVNAANIGRKGSWFTAFTKALKGKTENDLPEKRSTQEKKGLGKPRFRDGSSFIPLFRKPSSIEKILGEAEREHHQVLYRPPSFPSEQPREQTFLPSRAASARHASLRIDSPRAISPRVTSPRAASPKPTSNWAISPMAASPKASLNRVFSPRTSFPNASSSGRAHRNKATTSYRFEPTHAYHHASATKIQAASRGYMARRSFRALKGLVRLQGVVRGQSVHRQTMNAMKQMQLMVRIQTQIQSRRIQLLENKALQRHSQFKNDMDTDNTFIKWSMASELVNVDWEDSVLKKQEIEARMQKKIEATVKRERAMAYAHSHKLLKGTPKSSQDAFMDHRSGTFPWWWNWLERQLPSAKPHEKTAPKSGTSFSAPKRSSSRLSPKPNPRNCKQHSFEFDAFEALSPRSTKSSFIPQRKPSQTPSSTMSRAPTPGQQNNWVKHSSSNATKYSKPKPTSTSYDPAPRDDDDSLDSCPPFSAPSYMAPTASAKAKARAGSTPKEVTATPSRRFSFPFGQGIGSFKWKKGASSSFSTKDADNRSERKLRKDDSFRSIGSSSVDSTTSMPAGVVGRKPFNRFV